MGGRQMRASVTSGFDQFQPGQEPSHVVAGVVVQVAWAVLVADAQAGLPVELPCGHDQVAARAGLAIDSTVIARAVAASKKCRVIAGRSGNRVVKVDGLPDSPVVHDLVGVGDVPGHGQDPGRAGQRVLGVRRGQYLVVVGVDDDRAGGLDVLGDLVGGRGGGQPAADVGE